MIDQTNEATAKNQLRNEIAKRYEILPSLTPPTRDNTIVTMPLHDHRMDVETHKGLLSSFSMFAGEITLCGDSDVGKARNKIFNAVLATSFEWIVCIDSDIGFTTEDMGILLELRSDHDYAVNAVYAKKQETEEAVTQGLGFTRIHRSVLESIRSHLPFTYMDEGREQQDFCITGATYNKNMLREDTGFWFLCSQVGVIPRLETRVNLRHYGGRRAYTLSNFARDHL